MTGTASPAAAGQRVALQFAAGAGSGWRSLAGTRVALGGHFRLAASLRRSGLVRVVYASASPPSTGASTVTAFAEGTSAAGSTAGSTTVADSLAAPTGGLFAVTGSGSIPQRVQVAASLRVPGVAINMLSGQSVDLHGRLLPGVVGRAVALQARTGGGWQTVARARTGPAGRFRLQYLAAGTGRLALRVRFAGDQQNTRVSRPAGQLTVYRESVASWYDDAGATACGFHAHFGVANRDLPCGTAVTFDEGGRTVTAVVDDRGPFISGREWDLNQNTAAALGFDGVGALWSST